MWQKGQEREDGSGLQKVLTGLVKSCNATCRWTKLKTYAVILKVKVKSLSHV